MGSLISIEAVPPMTAKSSGPTSGHEQTATMVTAIMAAVVGLTFLFGFGNVLSLALRLGVPGWVAPLVAPAVDLSILGLLLAIRQLVARRAAAHERWTSVKPLKLPPQLPLTPR